MPSYLASSPYGLVLRPSPEHAAGTFAVGVVVGDPETLRSMPIEVVQVDLGDRLSCGVWFGYLRERDSTFRHGLSRVKMQRMLNLLWPNQGRVPKACIHAW